ncbi:MAG TPA: hypothetical protein DEP10_09815, partial [Alphaproteobacteria bacterium]|nr:hypothetical protein [Alphaproteobacteria bacterium]
MPLLLTVFLPVSVPLLPAAPAALSCPRPFQLHQPFGKLLLPGRLPAVVLFPALGWPMRSPFV